MSDPGPHRKDFCLPETTVLKNGKTGVCYQLESRLGEGSFGVAYGARQLGIGIGEPIAAAWSPDQSQGSVIKVRKISTNTHAYEFTRP